MRTLVFLFMTVITSLTHQSVLAQDSKTETFKVYGNCGMCKKRIEKAAVGEGIAKADWNVETKIMTITYDPSKTTNAAIQKKIAAVGHDTEKEKASDSVYNKLPGCCLYDRSKADKQADHSGHQH
ncbi:heavy-metal-associated domain-containing protein [Paraflavitalea sp. CAU 1676]|uniref:heavy-metal-associated domain-containing protein n=1 Tax=Paraflavitalea sp. CAU 1676 TaxID=3032598 RepID=UPI0023DC9E55|nr:heavy-metal-associated domain-containing protein [Paraflavitalea sp. CAU 1676]MDF2188662.1 heavy-metal-associated domain-containing protein [Paraflavitalea sp. CAU 1676]